MYKIVTGNLLEATEHIIVQQVNCMGVMGSGIAKQIRAKYPNNYTVYKEICNKTDKEDLLGNFQVTLVSENKYVGNLFSQLNFGRDEQHTNYNALQTSLTRLKNYAKHHELTVAIPYGIGCGLGGGVWSIVLEIINKVFEDYAITIYKYN